MIRVLFILQQLFSLWMLVDAIRRGSKSYWYFVVLLPFGEWAYFFMVKIHDPEFEPLRALWKRLTTRKVTVEDLRYQRDQSPSYANHLTLGQALYDEGSYREARETFAQALAVHPGDREAHYGWALSQIALEEYDPAIEKLRTLVEEDPSFRDYAAWGDLAHALCEAERFEDAFEVLDRLVTKSPRLVHRVLYAHYLVHGERPDEARRQLEEGLHDDRHAPGFIRKKNRPWVRRAKKMLHALDNPRR